MAIASFGKKKFNVNTDKIFTFNSLSRSGSLDTEEIQRGKGKKSIKIKGNGLDSFSITIPLRNKGINVQKEIKSWKNLKDSKKRYYFMLGGEKFGKYRFFITSIEDSDYQIQKNGIVHAAKLKVTFSEYYYKKKKKKGKNTRNKKKKKRKKKKK